MYKEKQLGVVVPAYNEEKLIGVTIESIPNFVDYVVVVDDCSRDGTADCVRQRQATQPERLILIRHEANQGVGGSIATGYTWCRDHEVDVAVVMAGDAQMDPADLPALLDPVVADEVDYTKGNRLFTGDAWKIIPRMRYLGNSLMSLLTKIASGYWHVADSQSGYTAINLRALKTIDWDKMYKRYGQPNDLLVRLNVYNFRVRDVPVRPVYNIGEKSGIKPLRMIPKLSWLLFKLFLWRMKEKYIIRDFHPLLFFYTMGTALFIPGFGLGVYLLIKRILVGPVADTSALFAAFLVIMGLQMLFFAMWFDMDYNKELR
ncbi:MAG: glycosyltransferase family 2 protein [Chloroflexi bacterium]|nr:glycosyltransferase family 2 protein [Chloroflexota bacterium]MCI0645242.1 glycosyltransferase family 2 protein [Chloroflexota bacterium]MCI0725314.1 glycosyltransferase family 2 protein [Chloroflexota bacterium]